MKTLKERFKKVKPIRTENLEICLLSKSDSEFILELVNTEGWLKFMGERNVKNKVDSEKHIQKIQAAANWVNEHQWNKFQQRDEKYQQQCTCEVQQINHYQCR